MWKHYVIVLLTWTKQKQLHNKQVQNYYQRPSIQRPFVVFAITKDYQLITISMMTINKLCLLIVFAITRFSVNELVKMQCALGLGTIIYTTILFFINVEFY